MAKPLDSGGGSLRLTSPRVGVNRKWIVQLARFYGTVRAIGHAVRAPHHPRGRARSRGRRYREAIFRAIQRAHASAAAQHGLVIGLWWFIPGIVLAIAYSIFTYRHFAGKVDARGAD